MKRFFSILLTVTIILSSVSLSLGTFSAEETVSYTNISDYSQFLDFLSNANNTSADTKYYKLANDITADTNASAIGGYIGENIVFDGDGHTINGLNINGALFDEIDKSQIINASFNNINVTGTENTAVVANDALNDAIISDCTFKNCVINIPSSATDEAAYGVVAAESKASIMNCQVIDGCKFVSENAADIIYYVGGIVGYNSGYVAGCCSKVSFDNLIKGSGLVAGSLTGANGVGVYSSVSATDNIVAIGENSNRNSKTDTVVELSDGNYIIVDDENASASIEYVCASLSQAAQSFNNSIAIKEGYPLVNLWALKDNAPVYADDDRNAYVFLNIEKELSGAVITPSWDSTNITVGENGAKIPVCACKKTGSDFVCNSFEITFNTSPDKMVNNFVFRGVYNYVYTFENIMDSGANGTYSDMFFAATKTLAEDKTVNKATVTLYPFDTVLSLSNNGPKDEVVMYCFEGDGTARIPYKISSEQELRLLAQYVEDGESRKTSDGTLKFNEAHYMLTKDIELSDREWEPIGVYSSSTNPPTAFRGVFDGQAHTIKNMKITKPESYKGLFGYVYGKKNGDTYENAVIKNLNVLDVSISDVSQGGGSLVNRGDEKGAVIGTAVHATISGCAGSGDIEGRSRIAGVVGYAMYCDINSCGSFANIYTHFDNAWSGGITSFAEYSSVKNCYSASDYKNMTVTDDIYIFTGGIAGYVKGSGFDHNFFLKQGDITTVDYNGTQKKDSDYLKSTEFVQSLNDYADEHGYDASFGFKSSYDYPVVISDNEREYKLKCLSTSKGKFTTEKSAYLPGERVTLIPPTNASEYPEPIVKDVNGAVLGLVLTEEDNGKYSFIMPKQSVQVEPRFSGAYLLGAGSSDEPYLINNFNDLCLVSDFTNDSATSYDFSGKCYRVTADIDGKGKYFNPISSSYLFSGSFDGGGHTISNMLISGEHSNLSVVGFFGKVSDFKIKNCAFKNITVEGNEAAVLVGITYGLNIQDVSISNCTVNAVNYGAGVLLYDERNITMKNCLFSDITISGKKTAILTYKSNIQMNTYRVENTVLENFNGASSLVYETHPEKYYYSFSDLYYCNCSFNYYMYNGGIYEVSASDINSNDFIVKRSELASEHGYCSWGENSDERIALALSDDVHGIYKVDYSSEFSTGSYKPIDLETAPVIGVENDYVTVRYEKPFYTNNITVKGDDGRTVEYVLKSVDDNTGAIQFVMPDCGVTISNNGQSLQQLQPLSGNGTSSSPYLVTSADDLMTIANVINGNITHYHFGESQNQYNNAYFKMTNDIDMNGVSWIGIGMNGAEFAGTFNGDYHTISNLNQNTGIADGSRQGLFAVIGSGGKVENLTIKSATIFSESIPTNGSGAIAKVNKGVITKCMVFDSTIQLGNWVNLGGIAGRNEGTIEYCGVVNTSITRRWGGSSSQTMGGITQTNTGTVSKCYTYKCSLNNGTSQNGPIIADGNAPDNCYYYNEGTVNHTYGTSATSYEFSSGYVTYRMNGNVTEWRQNVTYSPLDSYPYPDPSHYIVYYNSTTLRGSYTNIKPSYYPGQVHGTRTVILGDVNRDGKVDELDKQKVIDFFNKKTSLDKSALIACDVNKDLKITIEDFKILAEHLRTCKIGECDILGTEVSVSLKVPEMVELTDDGKYMYSGDDIIKNEDTQPDDTKPQTNNQQTNSDEKNESKQPTTPYDDYFIKTGDDSNGDKKPVITEIESNPAKILSENTFFSWWMWLITAVAVVSATVVFVLIRKKSSIY